MSLKTAVLAFLCFIFLLSFWDSIFEDFYVNLFEGTLSFGDISVGYLIVSFIGLSIFLFLNQKLSREEDSPEN